LKQRGAREVWGVEIDEAAGQRARKLLDRVLIGDVAGLIDQLPDEHFDVVVFNDVLEHMVDPFDVLTRIKGKISRRGVVVSSIPNIRYYWAFRDLLVYGEWEYEESGILDWTHLRFFTFKSIRKMYGRLGYKVLRHEGINQMTELPWTYRLANAILRNKLADMHRRSRAGRVLHRTKRNERGPGHGGQRSAAGHDSHALIQPGRLYRSHDSVGTRTGLPPDRIPGHGRREFRRHARLPGDI